MKKIKIILSFILFFSFVSSIVLAGGGVRKGTVGATELQIPVGARGIAMGGATTTNSVGLDGLYWNPAALARGKSGVDVMFSHMNYIADIGVEYGGVATNIEGFGTIGLTLKTLGIGKIPTTTVAYPDGIGLTYTPQYMTIGLTYSKMLSDKVSFGFTINYVSEEIEWVSTSGVAFSMGVLYTDLAGIKGLDFGIALKHLGPTMSFKGSGLLTTAKVDDFKRPDQLYTIQAASFELPACFDISIGYSAKIDEDIDAKFAGTYTNQNYFEDEYKFGVEFGYQNLLFARAGYVAIPKLNKEDNLFGFSAGFGINYETDGLAIKVDYAYKPVQYFGANHIFTIGFGL